MLKNKTKMFLLYFTSLIILPAILYLEYWSGFKYEFTLLYIVAITALTWFGGRTAGIILAFLTSGLWYYVNFIYFSVEKMTGIVLWKTITLLMLALLTIYIILRLKESLENEKRLSRSDPLTGLPNRRHFEDIASVQYNWCKRKMASVSLAFIDIDNFKEVNDSMGHDEGDRLLVDISNSIKESVREVDLVARMGGDEFILFLPETDEFEAKRLLTRIQGEAKIIADANKWPISFSIGVVTDHLSHKNIESLIKKADSLMSEIKRSGKDGIKAELIF